MITAPEPNRPDRFSPLAARYLGEMLLLPADRECWDGGCGGWMADVEVRCSHSPTVPLAFHFPHPCFPQPTTPPSRLLLIHQKPIPHALLHTPTPPTQTLSNSNSNSASVTKPIIYIYIHIYTYIYIYILQNHSINKRPPQRKRKKKPARRKKIHDDFQPPSPTPNGAFLPPAFLYFSFFFAKKTGLDFG